MITLNEYLNENLDNYANHQNIAVDFKHFDKNEILSKFSWFFEKCKTKDAVIYFADSNGESHLIWESGTFINGHWEENGIWEDGNWLNGTWWGGIWGKGTWKNGSFRNGDWYNGTWKNGIWSDGQWHNGVWENGTWINGTWHDGTWKNGKWKKGIDKNGNEMQRAPK